MTILRFEVSDKICLKKKHPCGNDIFIILRTGSDVRIKCEKCARDLTIDRISLEKMIKKVIKTN